MRPTLALLLTGLLLASLPASADFQEVTDGSGLETVDSGPLNDLFFLPFACVTLLQ